MKIPEELRLLATLVFFVAICGVSTYSKADEKPNDREIKIFSLVNAQSESMLGLISELGFDDVRLTADRRTNSVICTGPPTVLREIEAILMKLDQQETLPQKASKGDALPTTPALEIRSSTPGSISRLVENGTNVKKGHLLAVINSKPNTRDKRQLEMAAAVANARKKKLAKEEVELQFELELANKSHEIAAMKLEFAQAKAKAEIAALETELASAQTKAAVLLDRAKIADQQRDAGTAPETDTLLARLEAEMAKAPIDVLKLKLALQRNNAAPLEIAVAELEFLETKSNLQRLKHHHADLERKSKADVAAIGSLKLLQDERAKRAVQERIVAPADGIVNYRSKLKIGAMVRENQTLFKLLPDKVAPPKK